MATPNRTFQNLPKDKRERIINVAAMEFGEKGYSGASINNLVERLKIAKGSIFQYFGDKKGLFLFIFDKKTDLVKKRLRVIRDNTGETELFLRLEKTLWAGITFLEDNPLIYRLYLNVLFDSKIPFRDEILLSLRQYSYSYLHSLLKEAKTRGELRDGLDIDKACFILDAIMDRFLQTHTIRHLDSGLKIYNADEETIKSWITALVDIIRNGIGKEKNLTSTTKILQAIMRITDISNNSRLNNNHKFQHILNVIVDVMNTKIGSIMIMRRRKNLEVIASTNQNLIGIRQPVDDSSHSSWVVKNKKPLFSDNTELKDFFINNYERYKKESFLIAPVLSHNKVIGVINVTEKNDRDRFSHSEKQTLLTIAGQIISSVENHRSSKSAKKKEKILE
jgi:TetR/AcrR family transcriptional regulator